MKGEWPKTFQESSPMSPLDIHDAALAIESADARRRYLDEACRGDETLRRRVEAMLCIDADAAAALPDPGRFLRGWTAKKLSATFRARWHA